jgi:hypothetical protein
MPIKKLVLALALTIIPVTSVLAQLSPQPTGASTDDSGLISSETGVDFTALRDLLAAGNWRDANNKTFSLVLQSTKRTNQGWLSLQSIREFSCQDLKIIDSLWTKYSQGRFGWSVQFPIFISTGNKPGRLVDDQAYLDFGDRVGWRKGGDWIIFKEDLTYGLDGPIGELPNLMNEYQLQGGRQNYTTLTKRMVECNLVSFPSNNLKK